MSLALVIGSAQCVWDDLGRVYELLNGQRPEWVLSVNDFACQWDGFKNWDNSLDAFVTFHAEKLEMWREKRLGAGLPEPGLWVTAPRRPLPDFPVLTVPNWGGSSAFLAVSCAVNHLRARKIIAAGCPLDYNMSHFDRDKPFSAAGSYRRGWQTHHADLRHRLRSMSGWTRDQYGEPDKGWVSAPD